MKLGIRGFKAKSGHRDVSHHENVQGMTGLKNPMWGVMWQLLGREATNGAFP